MPVNQKFTIMPFTSPAQNSILNVLAEGPISGVELGARLSITKQGLYKALRELLKQEVVIKEGRFFTMNKAWFSRLKIFIESGEESLGIALPEKRKVLTFKNTHALDIYWGHLFLRIAEVYKKEPFFFLNQHNWAINERPEAELFLYKRAQKMQNKILITLSVNDERNKLFKKKYSVKNIQIAIDEKLATSDGSNVCVVGDYVIVTKLSRSKKIKLVIEKNQRKATVWKRKFARNFNIHKEDI
jgi:hypothetical protein